MSSASQPIRQSISLFFCTRKMTSRKPNKRLEKHLLLPNFYAKSNRRRPFHFIASSLIRSFVLSRTLRKGKKIPRNTKVKKQKKENSPRLTTTKTPRFPIVVNQVNQSNPPLYPDPHYCPSHFHSLHILESFVQRIHFQPVNWGIFVVVMAVGGVSYCRL